jgi:hypothetical protein
MRYLKNNFEGRKGERIPHDLLNTLANFWNDLTVLGGALRRRSDGRHTTIEITPAVTDTDSYDLAKDPDGRQTVQHNPEDYTDDTDSHSNELQLHNVHLVKDGSNSIPFFVAATPLQGHVPDKVVGELYWATPDADRKADNAELVFRSVDIADMHSTSSKGKYALSLYGFAGCGISSVPYAKEVTNPKGSGRELEWRYPVACSGNPKTSPDSEAIAFVVDVSAGAASGSYAALSITKRTGTVTNGSIDYAPAGSPAPLNVPLSLDYSGIAANIEHNYLKSTEGLGPPEWTEDNTGHDGRYLRIGAGWSGGTYNNTTNGIAHDTSGTRAIDFANGLIYGDDFAQGETIDYGARKLFAFSGSKTETLDWSTRTLTAASAASPWTATLAFRIATSDPAKYVELIVGDGTLEIKDNTGERLGYFARATP